MPSASNDSYIWLVFQGIYLIELDLVDSFLLLVLRVLDILWSILFLLKTVRFLALF